MSLENIFVFRGIFDKNSSKIEFYFQQQCPWHQRQAGNRKNPVLSKSTQIPSLVAIYSWNCVQQNDVGFIHLFSFHPVHPVPWMLRGSECASKSRWRPTFAPSCRPNSRRRDSMNSLLSFPRMTSILSSLVEKQGHFARILKAVVICDLIRVRKCNGIEIHDRL